MSADRSQLSYADVMALYEQGRIDEIERARDRGQLDELRTRAQSRAVGPPADDERGGAS